MFQRVPGKLVLALLCAAAIAPRLLLSQPPASPNKSTIEEAYAAFGKNQLDQAERLFRDALDSSIKQGVPRDTVIARSGLGAISARKYQYREAFSHWTAARDLAINHGLKGEAAAVLTNLASVHIQLNNLYAAEPLTLQAMELAAGIPELAYRPQIILALAMIRAHQNRMEEAVPLFTRASELADRANEDKTLALIQNQFGSALIRAGRWQEAERPIQEAFRWRLFKNDVDLFTSFVNLAEIELKRGNPTLAAALARRSLELASRQSFPLSPIRHLLGRVLVALGNRKEADQEFSAAIDNAWRLRLEVLPADQFRLGAEFRLADLYEDAIENAAILHDSRIDTRALERIWIAAGERRSYLMRTAGITQEQLRSLLPTTYWEHLAKLRRLETQRIVDALPASEGQELDRLRVLLAELESSAGIRAKSTDFHEKIGQIKTLTPFLSRLSKQTVLISFHLGERRSHRWELSLGGLKWKPLAPRKVLIDLAKRFEQSVRKNDADVRTLGTELYASLFGGLTTGTNRASHWLLDLDGELFGAPLAATLSGPSGSGSPSRFLVEDHTLRVFPGATALLETGPTGTPGHMIAIADAVFNRADARSQTASRRNTVVTRGDDAFEAEQLPALPGSKVEAAGCASIWGSSTMLTGSNVRRSRIESEMAKQPSVIHFATHVLANPSAPDRSLLALGLNEQGQMEVLGTTDVMLLPASGSLVVLSGCHSASGAVLPGGGWLGMTRAWLLAGANAVVASQWPTPDDTGLLFQDFYRLLRNDDSRAGGSLSLSAAVALRQSQIKMARSNTWRAHPNYWATYQLTVRTQ